LSTILDRLPDIERQQILDCPRGQLGDLCVSLSLNYDSVRGALSRLRARQPALADPPEEGVGTPEQLAAWDTTWEELRDRAGLNAGREVPRNLDLGLPKPIHIDTPRTWMYASDFHCPHHNRTMLRRLVQVALHMKAETLVVGGDLLDFPTISKWPRTVRAPSTEQVSESAGEVLVYLSHYFEHIIVLPGNHDERMVKKIDDDYAFSRVIYGALDGRPLDCKLQVTNLDYILFGDEGHDWRSAGWVMGHPRWFSATPSKMVGEVALMKHRNVIGAHSHLQGDGWSKDARYHAIDPGHMTEPEMHGYHLQSDGLSRFPTWKAGFVLIQDNIVTLCADGKIHWSSLGA